MNRNNNAVVISTFTQRIAALKKHVSSKTQVVIRGKSYKLGQLIAAYQAVLDARALATAKRVELSRVVRDRNAAQASCDVIDDDIHAWVDAQWGLSSAEAEDFGFAAPKVGVKSADTKAQAAAKAKATRQKKGAPPPADGGGTTPAS